MKTHYSRKDFLTVTGKITCSLLLAGSASSLIQSCTTMKVYATKSIEGIIKVPLAEFLESNISIVRVEGLQYDILVSKKANATYSAVLMRCSHQDWNLTATSKGLNCGLHGSAFDTDGNVKNGPATDALKKFKVQQQDNYLIIS